MLRLLALILMFLILGQASFAATLLNYEHRVVRAAEQIKRIKADREYDEDGISDIKQLLPRSEKIEFEGRETTVDNTWLYVLLDSYAAQKDPQQRAAVLNEAEGRLRALDAHLRRAEAEASGQIDDPRDKIRDILSRPAFQPEPESAIAAFVKRVLRTVRGFLGEVYSALTRLLERLFGASAHGGWISNLVLILVLASAVIVAVRFAAKLRRPQAKRRKTRLVLGDEVAADATSRELAEAGLAAARAGDFRTAVRKLYVSLLYELSERNLIELEDSATNHEYLSKASRLTGLADPMRYLTDRFDYVWYGMFPSSEGDFAAYFASYEEAMERARSLSERAAGIS
jgi:hypothetical protein